MMAIEKMPAQDIVETGQIKKSFDAKGFSTVEFLNKEGDLDVKLWKKNKAELIIDYRIEGPHKEDIAVIIEALEDIEANANGSKLSINTKFYSSLMEINILFAKKTTMKIKGVGRVTLKDFDVKYKLYIPEDKNFGLETKYSDVKIDEISKNAELNLYDCNLECGNIAGELKLNLRYSDAIMQNAGNSSFELYDSDVEFKNIGDLKLVSKYSKIEIESCGNLDFNLYDDKVYIDKVSSMQGKSKYTPLYTGDLDEVSIDIYDGAFEAGNINNLKIKSKYSEITAGAVEKLNFDLYDDKLTIDRIGEFEGNSKYTRFTIRELTKSMLFYSTYDDNITIDNVKADFDFIKLEGKYTKTDLDFDNDAEYKLTLESKYTNLRLNESGYFEKRYHKEGSVLNAIYHTKGYKASKDSEVSFNTYNGTILIR